jgi:single-strand DNA-binding protein
MASVNKIILIGNLGRDPELRHTKSGTAVCNFSLATNEKRGGEDHTEWFNVVVWDKQAEPCQRYLAKGRQVYVEGRIQTRTYTDKEGEERKSVEVVAHTVQFLSGGNEERSGGGGQERAEPRKTAPPEKTPPPSDSFEDDEIPF